MGETPDFRKMARELRIGFGDSLDEDVKEALETIAEQLRIVWNARGKADADIFIGGDHADRWIPEAIKALDA